MVKINPIIHISGASGSGKSYLGKKLLDLYGNKIIVKDIDDLRDEFIKEYYGETEWNIIDDVAYQEYINSYIDNAKKQNIPIIFVGLNNHPWWNPDLYYDFHADYKFYIDIDDKKLLKQKCVRYLQEDLIEDFKHLINDEMAMNDMINDNEKFIRLICDKIRRECDSKEITKESDKWKNDYKSQGYTIANSDEIYNQVVSILNSVVKKGGHRKNKKSKRKKRKNNKTLKKKKY